MLFRYNNWEASLRFFENLLPATLKMLILSHRPFNPLPIKARPALPASPPASSIVNETKQPQAAIGGSSSGSDDAIFDPLSFTRPLPVVIDPKQTGVKKEKKIKLTPLQVRERNEQREKARLARRHARLIAAFPPEPEETR
jgi:hypothetical protein